VITGDGWQRNGPGRCSGAAFRRMKQSRSVSSRDTTFGKCRGGQNRGSTHCICILAHHRRSSSHAFHARETATLCAHCSAPECKFPFHSPTPNGLGLTCGRPHRRRTRKKRLQRTRTRPAPRPPSRLGVLLYHGVSLRQPWCWRSRTRTSSWGGGHRRSCSSEPDGGCATR
jgi:hypothetical protein